MLAEAILRYIADPASGDFDDLAARAAAAAPGDPVPELARAAAAAVLTSSGAAGSGQRPVLALAAEGESSLTDEALATRSDEAGARPIKPRGIDPVSTRSWLAARQRDRRPALLVGPVAGFEGLLAPIERRGLRFRLPSGSSALVMRGFEKATDDGMRARLIESLGLTAERLWIGWQADSVATPFVGRWEVGTRFPIPHWVRAEVDADGRLSLTDLANFGGPLRVATGERARLFANGFSLR